MTSPYVYTPKNLYPTYEPSHYIDPSHYATPKQSPFIPAAVLSGGLYPPSPYTSALTTPLPPSPNYAGIPLPGSPAGGVASDYIGFGGDYGNYVRPRTTSFPGNTTSSYYPTFLSPTNSDYFRDRRRSFGAHTTGYNTPAWTSWYNNQIPVSSLPFQIHPWLNGEHPSNDFRFDLSNMMFNPTRLADRVTGAFIPLSREELYQPATHPPITRLRIVCDMLPPWPIDFEPLYTGGLPPPILLADILIKLHSSMHQRISHGDWAVLNQADQQAINLAFSRRCAGYGPNEMTVRSDGVKRVDFLMGRVWFRGLVPTAEKDVMKLVLA